MSQTYRYPSSSSSVSISAIGTNGATNPSTSIQIGGQSPSNTLLPLAVDASGQLIIASITGTSDVNITKIGGAAITEGQKTMAASLPVVIASDQGALTFTLPTGASTSALQTTGNTSLASIDTKTPALGQALAAASVPVVLTAAQLSILTPLSTVAVTGTFWQATQPVSAASLPLPTGAATETTLAAASAKLPATLGQKAMAASLAVAIASDQSALPISAASLPLPSGAATSALQTTINTSIGTMSAKLPAALGQTTSGASMAVVIASDQSSIPVTSPTSTATSLTNVSGSASSVSILASNASRKNATFYNDSSATLYLKLNSGTASATSYSVQIQPGGYYELPLGSIYTGAITGIWSAANGAVRITELS